MDMTGCGTCFGRLARLLSEKKFWIGITYGKTSCIVGGSLKRRRQAEDLLWQGQVDAVIALFNDLRPKQAQNFCAYLDKHRQRIVNYGYYQAEQLCSIGSGTVESAVKQIGRRLKISGAQWKPENVPQALQLRCAYLNGLLAI